MKFVGTYDAKTRLPLLIAEAEAGETVIITRRGKPVARLVAEQADRRSHVEAVIARIKSRRSRIGKIPKEELLKMRHEGHRF